MSFRDENLAFLESLKHTTLLSGDLLTKRKIVAVVYIDENMNAKLSLVKEYKNNFSKDKKRWIQIFENAMEFLRNQRHYIS